MAINWWAVQGHQAQLLVMGFAATEWCWCSAVTIYGCCITHIYGRQCSHISVIIHCLIYTTTRTKILDMVMPLHCLQAQGWHPHFGSGNGLGVIWFCISLQSNGCLSFKDKTQHNFISFILAWLLCSPMETKIPLQDSSKTRNTSATVVSWSKQKFQIIDDSQSI